MTDASQSPSDAENQLAHSVRELEVLDSGPGIPDDVRVRMTLPASTPPTSRPL